MRPRMASPVLPFDRIPSNVVEAARRVFDILLRNTGMRKSIDERGEWSLWRTP